MVEPGQDSLLPRVSVRQAKGSGFETQLRAAELEGLLKQDAKHILAL